MLKQIEGWPENWGLLNTYLRKEGLCEKLSKRLSIWLKVWGRSSACSFWKFDSKPAFIMGWKHNVLGSSHVVEVGQILFFINQTLQMILMVLVMVVDWCAHLFLCLGPLLGPRGGPEGALEAPKSLKTGYLALITSNAPKKGWTRLKVGWTLQDTSRGIY